MHRRRDDEIGPTVRAVTAKNWLEHDLEVAHRDLKQANSMPKVEHGPRIARVADVGIG